MKTKRGLRTATIVVSLILAMYCLASNAMGFGQGSKGADVYALQGMLQSIGYYTASIDGDFGPKTAAAVTAFQRAAQLAATGDVDVATLRSIFQAYIQSKTNLSGGQADGRGDMNRYSLSADEQRMIQLVNAARAEANLELLAVHPELSRVARFKSEDMALNQYFSHDSPTYGSPFEMMRNFGVTYTAAGENIACNQTVDKAHDALMNSPGHRANILNTDFTHIGIGIVDGGPCGAMYTQMFLKP